MNSLSRIRSRAAIAKSGCGIEIITLPKPGGCPDDDEYFFVANAKQGQGDGGYALRSWEAIKECICHNIEIRDPLFIYADEEPGLVSGTSYFTDPTGKLAGWEYLVEVRNYGLLDPDREINVDSQPGYFIGLPDYEILPHELHIIYFKPKITTCNPTIEFRDPLFIYADQEPGFVSGTHVFTDPDGKLVGWDYNVEVRQYGLLNPEFEVDVVSQPGYVIELTDYVIQPNELHIIHFRPKGTDNIPPGGPDKFGIQDNLGLQNRAVDMEGYSLELRSLLLGLPIDLDFKLKQLPSATTDKVLYYDSNGKVFSGPLPGADGPITGIIIAPSGTITVPPGMWRELVLEVTGAAIALVSVGLTPGGSELADNVLISDPMVVFVERRFKVESTIYITTTNNLLYELYKA